MEIKYLWNHNAFWQIIIMYTLLEDIFWKKYNGKKIYEAKNGNIIKDNKLCALLENLRKHRNNIVHKVIENELYWQVYSWNILITDNWKLSFENSNLSNEWKKMFGKFYKEELKPNLDDNFLQENNWKLFFPALIFYIIKKI